MNTIRVAIIRPANRIDGWPSQPTGYRDARHDQAKNDA